MALRIPIDLGAQREGHTADHARSERRLLCRVSEVLDLFNRLSGLTTFRRKIRLSRVEVIWNACWKDDTPPVLSAGRLVSRS